MQYCVHDLKTNHDICPDFHLLLPLTSLLARARQRRVLLVADRRALIPLVAAPQQPTPQEVVQLPTLLEAAVRHPTRLAVVLPVLTHLVVVPRALTLLVEVPLPIRLVGRLPTHLEVVQLLIHLAVGLLQPIPQEVEHRRRRAQEVWEGPLMPRLGLVVIPEGRVSEATSRSGIPTATVKSAAAEGCRSQGTAGNRPCKGSVGSLDRRASTAVE